MIDLSNTNVFVTPNSNVISSNVISSNINRLFNFLSVEYIILNIILTEDQDSQYRPSKSTFMCDVVVNYSNYEDLILKNLFRVNMLVIYTKYKIDNKIYKFLKDLNIIIFIVTPQHTHSTMISDSSIIYEFVENPEYINFFNRQTIIQDFTDYPEKYLFKNSNSGDIFSLDQYKTSYIRDKKIDNLFDESI